MVLAGILLAACTSTPQAGSDVAAPDPAVTPLTSRPQPTATPTPFFWEPEAEAEPASSIPLDEILPGGPPPDGIPPIDEPAYETVEEADAWLDEREPVMVVERGGESRAYPLRILTYHEIVNDTLGGEPTLVTYCPLCNSGLAFDPVVDGRTLDFGTSGRLYQSNLVMYDRATHSLWSQFTGEAVVGELLGTRLERLPVSIVAWEDYRAQRPDGSVLSQGTGFSHPYGSNPYVGYGSASSPFLFEGPTDDAVPQMARVVATGGAQDPVPYPLDMLRDASVVHDRVDGQDVVVWWVPGTASTLDTRETNSTWTVLGEAVAGPMEGTQSEQITHDDTFWLVQYAFRPQTRIATAG